MPLLRPTLALLLAGTAASSTLAQDPAERARIRQDKLERILRLKDERTVHDGTLIKYLGDPDPVVRRKATGAFGSIQDTTIVPLLIRNLTDPDGETRRLAAFAIGQTGGLLSEPARRRLEDELIVTHLPTTDAAPELIEEIGKFGTPRALEALIDRIGRPYPRLQRPALVRCIARFAIRGVTSPQATDYVLLDLNPNAPLPFDEAYALQRIGDRPETRRQVAAIVGAIRLSAPLARMHLATLLGKIADPGGLETLMNLADSDADWRVRVNAFRALSKLDLRPRADAYEIFKRGFYHENLHVRITSVAAFAETRAAQDSSPQARQAMEWLERLAVNPDDEAPWQLQAEAASTFARMRPASAARVLLPLARLPQPKLRERLLIALGSSGDPSVLPELERHLASADVGIRLGSLQGMEELARRNKGAEPIRKARSAAFEALRSGDVALVATAAGILADSLFRTPETVDSLIAAAGTLRVPDDIEALQAVVGALGRCGDARAVRVLLEILRKQPDRSVALATADALKSITGKDYRSSLPRWIQPLWADYDWEYLRAMPETLTVKIETIRGEILCAFYKSAAPFTVMTMLKLSERQGYFRGLNFHRVVPNFVVQGGDPRRDGWGGPGFSIRSEFSPITYDRGVIGMASSGKDTEGSQFFIMHSPAPHLDGRYTVIGRVLQGEDVVDRLQVDDRLFDLRRVE